MNTKPLIELSYYEGEDGLLYPDLQISEDEEYDTMPVGKFGSMWKDYMLEQHPFRVTELIFEGKINRIITEVDEEAENYKEVLIQEILKKQPLPDTEDTLGRAAHMNMIYQTAEEIVLNELVLKIR